MVTIKKGWEKWCNGTDKRNSAAGRGAATETETERERGEGAAAGPTVGRRAPRLLGLVTAAQSFVCLPCNKAAAWL